MRRVAWFSCGAASALTAALSAPDVVAYCETNAEHPDNERFLTDCERAFGFTVTRLRSDKYRDTWDVWERRKYLAGIEGATCTLELKVKPRLAFQRPDDIHIFGYTADTRDRNRAKEMREAYPEMTIETPLIERDLTKANCIALLQGVGVDEPVTYQMGFPNANCIPCPKATSIHYWALVRKVAPSEFERMAKLSRQLGVRLTRLNGVRIFIDEIPADIEPVGAIAPACDMLCSLVEEELRG